MSNEDPTSRLEHFRQRTLAELEHRRATDALPVQEYERRVELARRATSPNDFRPLLSELAAPVSELLPAATGAGSDFVLAVMSGSTRDGNWEPSGEIIALAIMGGVVLDFRDAALLEGRTRVHAFAIMGGVRIVVPPDIHISVKGIGLMGGFGGNKRTAPEPGAPLIEIDGLALMGGVEVKVLDYGVEDPEG